MEIVINNLYNNAVITLICYQDAYNQAYLNLETQQKKFYHIAQKLLSHEETKAYYDSLEIDKYYNQSKFLEKALEQSKENLKLIEQLFRDKL